MATGQLARREDSVCTFTPVSGMRPYDLTFCAGPFSTAVLAHTGRTEVTVRHRRSLLGQTAVASLPQFTGYGRDAIEWYADNLGVPCPYPAYDIVFMPDLAAMALAAPGLMVVNEKLLGRPAQAGDQLSAMICAHEARPDLTSSSHGSALRQVARAHRITRYPSQETMPLKCH